MRRTVPWILLTALLLQGCASKRPPAPAVEASLPPLSLDACAALDHDARAARRAASARLQEPVDLHEKLWFRRLINVKLAMSPFNPANLHVKRAEHRIPYFLQSLEAAAGVDPTDSRLWLRLANYRDKQGDDEGALQALDRALLAAPVDPAVSNLDASTRYVDLRRAWILRRLGRCGEAMEILEQKRTSGGLGSRLLHALLLGDLGRTTEARKAAIDLPPVMIPNLHLYSGINPNLRATSYAERWVQANAWRVDGDPAMARHALRDLNLHLSAIPYAYDFWQDVGLVHELAGDAESAREAYVSAVRVRQFDLPFLTWDNFSVPPLIGDLPQLRTPVLSVADTELLAGSRFSLACMLMAECSQAADPEVRASRGEAARRHFSICMARGIHPTESLALRGRTSYHLGHAAAAETDLREACDSLAREGRDDAGSLLVLGVLLFQDDRLEESLTVLERAAAADPTLGGVWRTLGAAYATAGRDSAALAAMDRAVDLDPGSSQGWFNRGKFHAEHGRLEQAATDLAVAVRIAPGVEAMTGLSQQVARRLAEEQGQASLQRALDDGQALASTIPSVREGQPEASAGAVVLGRSVQLDLHDDRAARADSLLAALPDDAPQADRLRVADALLQADRLEEAGAVLATGGVPDDDPLALVLRLRLDRADGDPRRALALVTSRPDLQDPELWALAAMICLEHGHRDEGLTALDRALAADPGNTGLMRYREFVRSGG